MFIVDRILVGGIGSVDSMVVILCAGPSHLILLSRGLPLPESILLFCIPSTNAWTMVDERLHEPVVGAGQQFAFHTR